ncbi:MAG: 4Fe-4S binding protein [Acidobacteria bacterium]|nr:4Fe-4S binding protein [Acidobacteriota bacterium]
MSVKSPAAARHGARPPVWKSLLKALPFIFLTAFMLLGGGASRDPRQLVPLILTFALISVLFFRMVHTGRTDRYRAVFFILMAFCFVLTFITNLIEVRGSMALTEEDMATGQTPFCHMVIPMTIIPAAFTRTIIFPGSILDGFANIATMFALWIGVTLALGRGFCSWGCFFGGLEDGFSRLRRKPLLRKIGHHWTYLPYAVLGAMVLLSAWTLTPSYCEWLCPFKAVTEFEAVTSTRVLIQTIMFGSLFAGLVVVLPILTRRRTQCGLLCPMGAFQSFSNKINAFDIRIDREKCTDCGQCIRVCPTFSLDANSVAEGKTRLSCTKCGKCVDACPQGAISFHVKGTPVGHKPERARMLFLYPAFLFLVVFGTGMIQGALYRIVLLVTTGSLIQ